MSWVVELTIPTHNEAEIGPIIGRIAGQCGGFTVTKGSGGWIDDNGTLVLDKVSVVKAITKGEWTHADEIWWNDLAMVVCKTWRQDVVVYTVSHTSDTWVTSVVDSPSSQDVRQDKSSSDSTNVHRIAELRDKLQDSYVHRIVELRDKLQASYRRTDGRSSREERDDE